MTLETKLNLEAGTLDKLQKLIRANIDSNDGFQEAAKVILDAPVASLFRRLASERAKNAEELQTYVNWNGQEAEEDGSVAAYVHRVWIKVRSILSVNDTHAILSEAERGEDHIKHAYEDVLKETAGSAMNDVLQRQYANVKAGHDQILKLRNELQAVG